MFVIIAFYSADPSFDCRSSSMLRYKRSYLTFIPAKTSLHSTLKYVMVSDFHIVSNSLLIISTSSHNTQLIQMRKMVF